MIRAALLSTLLLSPATAALAQPDPVPPDEAAPMVVTSDTDAYCESLSRQLNREGKPLPQHVAALRDQGQHLCAAGQVRTGINRLRRALMALRDAGAPDDDTIGEIR